MTGWSALKFQWFKDFQVWLFIALYLLVFQAVLIFSFKEQISETSSFTEILTAMGMGLRFDGAAAAVLVVLLFFASITTTFINWGNTLHKLRLKFLTFFIIALTLLCGIDLVFFYEYGDQFNQMIFGLTDDDTKAILITVWKEYHPIRFLLIVSLIAYLVNRLAHKWLIYTPNFISQKLNFKFSQHNAARFLIALMIFMSFFFVARGASLTSQPLRQHHAFITKDMFLNKTILTPLAALRYAIVKRIKTYGDDGLDLLWPEKDLQQALKLVSGKAGTDIDNAIKHTVIHENKKRPKHIFLILMESHSGWTVWPKYRELGFSPQLSALADKGIYFKNFIPTGPGTMSTLNVLFTGLPYSGLSVNYETSALKPYPFSVAETFKRMGYRTRFYYGGFLGWQRVDNMATAQGFDELHGGGTMSKDGVTNEWGIDDEHLFNFISDDIDNQTPSFNIILTTSNHPPYDLDLDKIGFKNHRLGKGITTTKEESLRTLGHLWYADKELGKFVKRIETKLENPLFAITGDHTTHLQMQFKSTHNFEHLAVPLVLYGPKVLEKNYATQKSGSHLDILPTLYSLAAAKNFEYYAFGKNLLGTNTDTPSIGTGYYIANGVLYIGKHAFPLYQGAKGIANRQENNTYHRANQAISWYRVRKGKDIKLPSAINKKDVN